jgi:hypothetical protein
MRRQPVNIKIFIQVKISPIFTFLWDGIDIFGMTEKLSYCVQVLRKKWYKVAWNQIAEGKEEAFSPKEGEAKVEYVGEMHLQKRDDNSQARMVNWISGHRAKRGSIVSVRYI